MAIYIAILTIQYSNIAIFYSVPVLQYQYQYSECVHVYCTCIQYCNTHTCACTYSSTTRVHGRRNPNRDKPWSHPVARGPWHRTRQLPSRMDSLSVCTCHVPVFLYDPATCNHHASMATCNITTPTQVSDVKWQQLA